MERSRELSLNLVGLTPKSSDNFCVKLIFELWIADVSIYMIKQPIRSNLQNHPFASRFANEISATERIPKLGGYQRLLGCFKRF